jgi:hypothetical protein
MGADAIEPVGDLRGSAMALTEDLGKFGSDCCAQNPAVFTGAGALTDVGVGAT